MSEQYLNWNGLRIFVTDQGEGEPLLLINGLGGNSGMLQPLTKHIDNRRLITFDAPGSGRSSTPPGPIAIAALAELATAVLDLCGVEAADVLGYSYGGAIAQQTAFEHGSRVNRLVLAATNCGVGAVPGSFRAMQVLSTPFRYYSPTYFNRIARMTYGGRTGRNQAVRKQMLAVRRPAPPTSYGYAMQILGGATWSSLQFLDQIKQQTLVITGDDDPLIPVANARLLARRIPNAALDIVEGAGHLFLWDDAEKLSRRIFGFFDQRPAASPSAA
ncbi:MAG: alpha/beta hydrolase [Gammaproteobacteria bacterium]|nr:alpha/beta hydrolase [Gammaproteobacteria bacterium]